jgi:hypothetical protein
MLNMQQVIRRPEAQQSPFISEFCQAVVDLTAKAREFLTASNARWTEEGTNFANAEKREFTMKFEGGACLIVTEERMKGDELSHELYVTFHQSSESEPAYDIYLYTGRDPVSEYGSVSDSNVIVGDPHSDKTRSLRASVNPGETIEGSKLMEHFSAALAACTAVLSEDRVSRNDS